ncbi:MAG: putative toxin-antitoxin system toxin component, PIN family [Planctomycetota bacterium]
MNHQVTLCLSPDLLAEVRAVLTRPELHQKFPHLDERKAEQFCEWARGLSHWVEPVPKAFTIPAHSKDDHLFDLVIAAKAHRLVTWENRFLHFDKSHPEEAKRLLELAPQIRILNPPAFALELSGPPQESKSRGPEREVREPTREPPRGREDFER